MKQIQIFNQDKLQFFSHLFNLANRFQLTKQCIFLNFILFKTQ